MAFSGAERGPLKRSLDHDSVDISRSRRILQSVISLGLGQGINIVVQLFQIPILLYGWGPELTAEWTLLAAFPSYFQGADLGFGFVLANQLAMDGAAGKKAEAAMVYRSAWSVFLSLSIFIFLLAILISPHIAYKTVFQIKLLGSDECAHILDLFILQVLLSQHLGIFRAALRAEAQHVTGNYVMGILSLMQFLAMSAAVILHCPPVVAAGGSCIVMFVGAIVMLSIAHIKVSYLRIGIRDLNWNSVKKLVAPGLSTNLMLLGNTINLQGSVLLTGSILNPEAALLFSTMRTLARFVNQLTNLVELSIGPELSIAIGKGEMALAKALHRRAGTLSTWTGIAFSLLLALIGPFLFHLWTKGKLPFDLATFLALLCAQIVNGFYYGSLAIPMAINKHTRTSIAILIVYSLGIGIAYVLVKIQGLLGAGIESVVAESLIMIYTVPYACSLVGDFPISFIRSIANPLTILHPRNPL